MNNSSIQCLTKQYLIKSAFIKLLKITVIGLMLSLTGCSWVYRINIPQGNYLNDKDIALIEKGMTKDQITYLLGTPMLFDHPESNRWFYVYYYKPGHSAPIQKNLIVNFDDKGKVVDFQKTDVKVK